MRHPILAWTLLTLTSTGAQAVTRSIFVTSVSGTGDLGSWPDAGSATGLAAGDAICQARAAAAGLAHPNAYIAWLSSSTDDAYCRIHGLTGKRSDNCGQGSLPDTAGPWLRVDGLRFGARIHNLLINEEVFLPPRINENGNTVHGDVWTGTKFNGAADSLSCSSWTSATGFGVDGSTDHTGSAWGWRGDEDCGAHSHLYCIQTGAGDPLPAAATWGRLAFLSSAFGNANLGSWPEAGTQTGLNAGNAICRSLATSAGLPNANGFKAWLSSAGVDARDRFSDGPFMRLDRTRVANDLADLTDGFLHAPINLTETGRYLDNEGAWTGTNGDGLAAANRCGNWTSAAASGLGMAGVCEAGDVDWTAQVATTCDFAAGHLYCLQDLPLVFGDGFESHDTSVWSSAVP